MRVVHVLDLLVGERGLSRVAGKPVFPWLETDLVAPVARNGGDGLNLERVANVEI